MSRSTEVGLAVVLATSGADHHPRPYTNVLTESRTLETRDQQDAPLRAQTIRAARG